MDIPDEFNKIGNAFHQDTLLIYKTLDDAIQASIRMSPQKRKIAKDFFDELLSGKYSDEELAAIWNKTPANSGGFGIAEEPENGAAWFLGKIRSALESSLASNTNG
ncbi:MAG: hypothetical protein HYS06_05155 [Methylocystis sp.]|nr:hypothetical protein [Methylocystis sp.]